MKIKRYLYTDFAAVTHDTRFLSTSDASCAHVRPQLLAERRPVVVVLERTAC